MLIASLAKYWRPIDKEFYLDKMDIPMTQNAVYVSGFPEELSEEIWEIQREAFEIF